MNPVDKTVQGQSETLALEFDLPHPPERVWRALTEPALLAEWLLPVLDLKLEAGAAFTFQAPPAAGGDGVVKCRIREIEPLRKLGYSWAFGGMDTVVTFTLAPAGVGTKLRVEHSGFKPDQKRNFGGAGYGWKMMGGKLIDLLARIP